MGFKFTNKNIIKLIYENYRNNENIYMFEKNVNAFLKFLDEKIPLEYSIKEIPDNKLVNIPIEDSYKLVLDLKNRVDHRIKVTLFVTAYKVKLYLKIVLEGLNQEDFYPYFPSLRALLEHTSIFYYTLKKSKTHTELMNNNLDDIEKYVIEYGKFDDIMRLFILGTKNKTLIEESNKNMNIHSINDTIKFVTENSNYPHIQDTYKYLSEMSHPSVFNTNYFLNPQNPSIKKIDNLVVAKNPNENLYSLNPKDESSYRLQIYFTEIIYTINDCISIYQDLWNEFENYKVKSPNVIQGTKEDIMQRLNLNEMEYLEIKKFMESEEYFDEISKISKENKFKNDKKQNDAIMKLMNKKLYEIRKNNKKD